MKILFALLSTVAANRASDQLANAFDALGKGDIERYKTYFADDFTITWNFQEEFHAMNGVWQFGNKGYNFDKFLNEQLGAYDFFDMQHEDFAFPGDDNRCGYIGNFYLRVKATGQRWRSKFLMEGVLNADGKFESAVHTALRGETEKLDAGSLVDRAFRFYRAGDVAGVNALVHDDAVLIYSGEPYASVGLDANTPLHGMAEFWKMIAKFTDQFDMHSNAAGLVIEHNHQHVSADGKTAIVTLGFPYTRKSDGAEFYAYGFVTYKFDDHGLMTLCEYHVDKTVQTAPGAPQKEL